MLRINLLPSYVQQRQLTRKLIVGFSILFIACLAVPFYIYTSDVKQKQDIFDQMTAAEAGKAITDKAKADAASTRSQIQPIQEKVDFVAAVHKHNQDVVNFWNTVAAYSSGSKVIYSDAVVAGTPPVLTIKAYAPSIAEIGRYLQAMYHEPDFKSVGIDKLPGYPDAVVEKLYYGNQLIAVGTATGNVNGGTAPAGGAPNGQTGGTTGGPNYGNPAPVGTAALNVPTFNDTPTGSSASVNGATTSKQAAIDAGVAAMLNSPEFAKLRTQVNPFGDPVQQQNHLHDLIAKQLKIRREPQGFPVTITATLNQPLTPPTVPGAAPVTPGQ